MELHHEIGKTAGRNDPALFIQRRKNARKVWFIIPVALIAILAVSFRSQIKDIFTSGGSKSLSSGTENKNNGSLATGDNITILQRWELPDKLLEISGLAWLDNERFICVQDELGVVFIYNTAKGSIEKEIPFAGAGDYEGLALVGESVWVIRSDGNLYEINSIKSSQPSTKEYDTPLTADHNTEGLCYDQKNNRLLVAIKDAEPAGGDYKGIYGFDLASKKMAAEPVMKIDLKDEVFSGISSSGKKKAKKGEVMMPSGIAVHPSTGDIYITEGRNPKLLVTDGTKGIRALYQLDKKEFVQPEGITFSPSGDIYISNEGSKVPGSIVKLKLDIK